MTGWKRIMTALGWIALGCLAAALICLGLAALQNRRLDTERIVIEDDRLPAAFDGTVILQISDYHGDDACAGQIAEAMREAKPDLIAFTGDLMDPGVEEKALEMVRAAVETAPVYIVPGNHEARMENYAQMEEKLIGAGANVLRNEAVTLARGEDAIRIAGADDPDMGTDADYAALCEGETYTVLLNHRPTLLDDYAKAGAELVLTGHAHGGQVRLPFTEQGIIAPQEGFFPKYTQGVHRQGETRMVVSRGVANTYFPPRLFNPPQIVIVELRCGAE